MLYENYERFKNDPFGLTNHSNVLVIFMWGIRRETVTNCESAFKPASICIKHELLLPYLLYVFSFFFFIAESTKFSSLCWRMHLFLEFIILLRAPIPFRIFNLTTIFIEITISTLINWELLHHAWWIINIETRKYAIRTRMLRKQWVQRIKIMLYFYWNCSKYGPYCTIQ